MQVFLPTRELSESQDGGPRYPHEIWPPLLLGRRRRLRQPRGARFNPPPEVLRHSSGLSRCLGDMRDTARYKTRWFSPSEDKPRGKSSPHAPQGRSACNIWRHIKWHGWPDPTPTSGARLRCYFGSLPWPGLIGVTSPERAADGRKRRNVIRYPVRTDNGYYRNNFLSFWSTRTQA